MSLTPTIIVRLIKVPGLRRFPGRRPEQPWRYLVQDAGNNEPFERPTERYGEERGALHAIEQVHGADAVVVLRRDGHPDEVNWRGVNYVAEDEPNQPGGDVVAW